MFVTPIEKPGGGGPCLGGAVVGENLHVAPFCFKYQELYFYLNELLTERTYLYGVDVTITSHHLFKSRVRPNPSCHWMHNAESVSRIISTFHIDNKLKKKTRLKNLKNPHTDRTSETRGSPICLRPGFLVTIYPKDIQKLSIARSFHWFVSQ